MNVSKELVGFFEEELNRLNRIVDLVKDSQDESTASPESESSKDHRRSFTQTRGELMAMRDSVLRAKATFVTELIETR